jgi:hypothetical protein
LAHSADWNDRLTLRRAKSLIAPAVFWRATHAMQRPIGQKDCPLFDRRRRSSIEPLTL